ncbi:hypothetical protein ACFWPQ_18465 [Streptomyces sp. NPDC058464]|uniref:hypothetical protein n=1 Tax=Streptomyces sp. NPDC058464 TaxID=3346511 RepID=UPI003667909B
MASSPSGAPGAGVLAMTSPTAAWRAAAEAETDGEGVGETVGAAGLPLPGELPFVAPDMTARRVLLSYELTVSAVRWAGRPAPAEPAAVVAVAAGAAATASDCPSVRAAAEAPVGDPGGLPGVVAGGGLVLRRGAAGGEDEGGHGEGGHEGMPWPRASAQGRS